MREWISGLARLSCTMRQGTAYNRPPATAAVFGWGKKPRGGRAETKCEKCGTELYYPERLERHMKKAHGNVPAKKVDPRGSDGGLW